MSIYVFHMSFCIISQRVHDKKDVYNLNEEEELTHYGQSLAEMEKFNDIVNSDDESEEKGLLSGEYTPSLNYAYCNIN